MRLLVGLRRSARTSTPRAFSTQSVLSSRPPRNPENRASPLLLAHLVQALRQVLLVFLQQRRVPRAAVDLARFVLAFIELLARPFIVYVRRIGGIENLLRQLRRNERNALTISYHQVAGHHRHTTDADRYVNPRQRHAADRPRMH